MFRLVCILCLSLLVARPLAAAETPAGSAAASPELNLDRLSVEELEAVYAFYDYDGEKGYLRIPQYRYPPIFLKYFPDDYNTITNESRRNALFIKILAPLTLRLNNEILALRKKISAAAESFRQTASFLLPSSSLLKIPRPNMMFSPVFRGTAAILICSMNCSSGFM